MFRQIDRPFLNDSNLGPSTFTFASSHSFASTYSNDKDATDFWESLNCFQRSPIYIEFTLAVSMALILHAYRLNRQAIDRCCDDKRWVFNDKWRRAVLKVFLDYPHCMHNQFVCFFKAVSIHFVLKMHVGGLRIQANNYLFSKTRKTNDIKLKSNICKFHDTMSNKSLTISNQKVYFSNIWLEISLLLERIQSFSRMFRQERRFANHILATACNNSHTRVVAQYQALSIMMQEQYWSPPSQLYSYRPLR